MTRDMHCPTCRRSVQVSAKDETVCPVCSSPLVDVPGQREGSRGQATQGGGYEAHRVDINYPAENGWEHLESG